MKILSIDFGAARIGLAVGDMNTGIAFSRPPLKMKNLGDDPQALEQELFKIINAENIQKIIVGHPGALREEGTEQAAKCREFADRLEDFLLAENCLIPVEFADESFSTQLAIAQLRNSNLSADQKRSQKDSLAAAAFLQTYLDQIKKKPD